MEVLLYNFFIYLIWFILVYKREKRLTVYSFLILYLSVIAFLGYFTVQNKIYYDTFGYYNPQTLSLEPYIYSFVSYFLLLLPFRNLKYNLADIDFLFTYRWKIFVKWWTVIYSAFTILKLTEAIISISLGLAAAYETRHVDGVALFSYNIILDKFNGYATFFLEATTPIIILYAILGYLKKRIKSLSCVYLILLCFLPSLFAKIAMGSRGGLFMTFFCFLFFVIVLYKELPRNIIRQVYSLGIIFVIVVLTYSWLITVDRIAQGQTGFDSILRYFGEPFPNLGFRIWDKAVYHPMGERFFPTFFDNKVATYSVAEGHAYWEKITQVPILNFKTYYGDLYVEFGVLGAFVFIMSTSIPVYLYYKKKEVTIYNFAFLYFYFQLCVFAFSGFTKYGWGSIFQLIIISIFTLFIRFYKNISK